MLVFPAVLLPLSVKFQLSMTDTLALSFWMYLLFGISALPWGIAADAFGARNLLTVFHVGAGVCCIAAATVVDDPLVFSIALAGIGLFSGIYHPVGLGWIAHDIKNTSIGMAYNGMFGNLGLAIAPIFAGLLNFFYGVEAVYFFAGLVNFLGVILLIGNRQISTQRSLTKKETSKSHSYLPFIILLVAMMLGGVVYRGTSVSLPAYFELKNGQLFQTLDQLFGGIGTENVVATIITSTIYLLGMVGQFIGGKVGERFDLRYGYLVFHAITVPAALAMALTANIPLIVFAMIHSFFLLGMQPIENTIVSRLAPPNVMSSAYGMKFILTFGVGAIGVKVIEIVKVQFGLSGIFFSLAIISGILVGVILLLTAKTQPLRGLNTPANSLEFYRS